jgi:hypothetical protein
MSNPIIDDNGDFVWLNDRGQLHRIDGYAVKSINGDMFWYINGEHIYSLLANGKTEKGYTVEIDELNKITKDSIIDEVLKSE